MMKKDSSEGKDGFVDDAKREALAAKQQFARGLSNINDSRLMWLVDPLKRLQAFELALLIGGVLAVGVYLLRWWVPFVILVVNEVVVGYKYYQERKEYVARGGEL